MSYTAPWVSLVVKPELSLFMQLYNLSPTSDLRTENRLEVDAGINTGYTGIGRPSGHYSHGTEGADCGQAGHSSVAPGPCALGVRVIVGVHC